MEIFTLLVNVHFRQVQPSPENAAPGSLPEGTQLRNIRRVKVNAQVAFAIYVLEVMACFSMIVFWLFIGKDKITKTASLLVYYVILPYIYLMNTSSNKSFIIDYGWLNTARNALGFSTDDYIKIKSFLLLINFFILIQSFCLKK